MKKKTNDFVDIFLMPLSSVTYIEIGLEYKLNSKWLIGMNLPFSDFLCFNFYLTRTIK